MTDLFRDTLRSHAGDQHPPTFDADAIIREGDARARRTRLTTGLAAACAAGVIAAGAMVGPQLLGDDPDAGTVAGGEVEHTGLFAERKVTFAVEDVVHYGTDSFSVGVGVTSYVQTDDALVVTTSSADRAPEVVWRYDGHDAMRIGHADGNVVRADDTGSLVAWADSSSGSPEYVVFDTSTESEVARVPAATAPGEGPEVLALDDGAVYWRTAEGIARFHVADGTTELLHEEVTVEDPANKPPRVIDVVDVASGLIAHVEEDERASTLRVGETLDGSARAMPSGWHGVLSPDGRYVGVEDADELAVYDTATAEDVTPDLDGYPFKVVYGWTDEDTAMVFALTSLGDEPFVADFLSCDIPAGGCTVVAAGIEAAQGRLTLPVGDPMDS